MKNKILDGESLEFKSGYEYAENCFPNGEPIDINEMVQSTMEMPDGDYQYLRDCGIENPSAREFWAGFNSYYNQQ